MTGVRHALSEGLQGRSAITGAAMQYVQASVPDALAALKPHAHQLLDMTEATQKRSEGG